MQETDEQIREVDQAASRSGTDTGGHPDTTAADRRPADDPSPGDETTAERLAEPAGYAETDALMLQAVDDVGELWLDPDSGDWVADTTDAGHRATRLSAASIQPLIDRGDLSERVGEERTSTRLTETGRERLKAGRRAEDRYLLWSRVSEMIDGVEREFEPASRGARLSVELELFWDDGSRHRLAVTAPAGSVDSWGEKILTEIEEAVEELDKDRFPLALSWQTAVDGARS